jgi:hypothetical protein
VVQPLLAATDKFPEVKLVPKAIVTAFVPFPEIMVEFVGGVQT